jgi:hypothetical protein
MQDSFPFGQAASLFTRDDLPNGVLPIGTAPMIVVGTTPWHPSNAVLVQVRCEGGLATLLRAMPEGGPFQVAQQWYRAILPALDAGDRVDYRVELIRAGQCLATLPANGSWLTVIGDRDRAAGPGKRSPVQSAKEASSAAAPRWTYDLTFFATLTAELRLEAIGETSEGYRINFFVQSGHVVGPRIDAVVRPESADWFCIRRDGIGMLDIRATYETADGALIYERAGGICDLGSDGYAKIVAGQFAGTHPFYMTPTFVVAHPNWRWLNRCQGFGIGQAVLEDLRVECDIYFPQAPKGRRDG